MAPAIPAARVGPAGAGRAGCNQAVALPVVGQGPFLPVIVNDVFTIRESGRSPVPARSVTYINNNGYDLTVNGRRRLIDTWDTSPRTRGR
jgi:hypothetical protein